MIHAADTIAIRMCRILSDAGCDVRAYLMKRGDWTIVASIGDRQVGFGFCVSTADLLTNPNAFADYHAIKMCRDLGQ